MTIEVVCAIIKHNNKILVAQRGENMPHPGLWEFPGGKVEQGESYAQSIRREIFEELHMEIQVEQELPHFSYDYPDKTVVLIPFICSTENGAYVLAEHATIQWLKTDEMDALEWLPADVAIKDSVKNLLK